MMRRYGVVAEVGLVVRAESEEAAQEMAATILEKTLAQTEEVEWIDETRFVAERLR